MKKLTEDEQMLQKAVEQLADLSKIMYGMTMDVEYDGFKLIKIMPVMLSVCSGITDIDLLTHRINDQLGFKTIDGDWVPLEKKLPSGDDPVVPCGDTEGRFHRVFTNTHPMMEALFERAYSYKPEKKGWFK